ncbi:MAG: GAF domain-containing protein [Acetobacteraceae bacterium]|nr:GAF domain-containing protein [Acetobacteraceae bacterium]
MQPVEALIAAQAEADQPGAVFRALDGALATEPGHILFTVLLHHPRQRENERFYTNMPQAYPIGGRKPVTDSAWMRRVIHRGEPYVGRTRDDVREVFFDYELIWSLGCESVLNMPVRWAGQTLGTLNLLHRAGHYSEADLPQVRLMAALAVPAFLALTRD